MKCTAGSPRVIVVKFRSVIQQVTRIKQDFFLLNTSHADLYSVQSMGKTEMTINISTATINNRELHKV